MAVIAIIAARNMCCMLAGCRGAVVARAAGSQYLRMVDRYGRFESSRAMTVCANIGSLQVGRAFAGCCCTVVATHTISSDASMIEYRGKPCAHRMAVIALITG